MRYHFFLHYGWFFQNLGKEAVRTFMHTNVSINSQMTKRQSRLLFRLELRSEFFHVHLTGKVEICQQIKCYQNSSRIPYGKTSDDLGFLQ